jgi:hypothetical protein
MRNLKSYIQEQNSWTVFFKSPAINFPLTQAEVDTLARSLDAKLSPENLHCDGEISQTQAQNKYNYYGKVIRELDRYCAGQGLTMPTIYEYY